MASARPSPAPPGQSTPSSSAALAFARLSTSTKILLILTLALLPLGVIASLASIEAARAGHENRVLAAHLLAGDSADRLTLFLERSTAALRGVPLRGASSCRRAAALLGGGDAATRSRVAMFDTAGDLVCASEPVETTAPLRVDAVPASVAIDPDGPSIRLTVLTQGGSIRAWIPRATLARASHPNAVDGSYDLRLLGGNQATLRLGSMRSVVIGRDISTVLPVLGGQLRLSMTVEAAPLGANEALLLFLPLLMWATAAATGWLVVDRLLLRPLGQLERAIDQSRTRGGGLVLPQLTTPAHEIRSLGDALSAASATIAHHEAELEEGLVRQTRLTREVHHRVKNNLQVIASLLNIHARGAATEEATAAYAAIQRRVDALALVHRNHYAELEVNRGLSLRPLIGELCSSLRASVPRGTKAPAIAFEIGQVNVTQDVAVSVAFLITELVELAMHRSAGATIAIALRAVDASYAELSIRSPALETGAAPADEAYERCLRVVTGLARQLRSPLEHDEAIGRFGLRVAIVAPVAES